MNWNVNNIKQKIFIEKLIILSQIFGNFKHNYRSRIIKRKDSKNKT